MLTTVIIENALIIAAEGFWLSANWSQFRKLKKTGNTRGLSAPTLTLYAAGNIAWATYFALQHLWVPIATNLSMFLITLGVLEMTLQNRKQFMRGLATIGVTGPLTAYVLIHFTHAAGWLGVIYNTIAMMPWFFHVVTTKKTSGMSEHGFYYAFGAMLCTLTYAELIHSLPLITSCGIGISINLIIISYYYRFRSTH